MKQDHDNKKKVPIESYMLYLKTKGGVTVPLLDKRRTHYYCSVVKRRLENEFKNGWNGHLIINH